MIKSIKQKIPKKIRLSVFRFFQNPQVGKVQNNNLFSVKPISESFGEDRGIPIDRYYIEKFLNENSADIKGRVLEIGEDVYTIKYGGEKVIKSEILHASGDNPKATYVGDLTNIPQIPSETYDCIILTQTLQLIADLDSAVNTLYRILKKGGVLLISVPGISQIYVDKKNRWPDYWRFTVHSARWLFSKKFESGNIIVKSFGNVLTSIAFLHGLAMEELNSEVLDYNDDKYQMLITIKAIK